MSNLGAIGSQDYEAAVIQSDPNAPLANSNDAQTNAINQVRNLFQSQKTDDHSTAMKMLLAMMSKGYDIVEFSGNVVQMVSSKDAVCRQLAFVFLTQFAEQSPETSLLSVNSFTHSLKDSDPMVRALAIKVLSSIKHADIGPIILDAVNQVIGDPSPYVKKAASYAMIKACENDPEQVTSYIPLLERLLGDPNPIAFSGAIVAYWSLCPYNIDLLHPHFKSICNSIQKLDEWSQVYTLRALTVYSRYCFRNPELEDEQEEFTSAFWDESSAPNDALRADHLLLIHSAKQLLSSPNSAVVMASVSLLFYTAPSVHVSAVARPLVRLLYDTPLTAQIALSTILTIAQLNNHIFVPHLNHFFVKRDDPTVVKQLKLSVLCLLSSPSNAEMVLNELSTYTESTDREFAATAVRTMGKMAMCNPIVIPPCLVSLLKLMGRAEERVLAEIVLVIAHILRKKRGTEDEAIALKQLCRKFIRIKDSNARAAVLSIVGDMHETHPEFAPQLLRYVGQHYLEETPLVRLQSLTLAAKIIIIGTESSIPMYILKIGERDSEFDIRDRAIFLLTLLESESEDIKSKLRDLIFPARQDPTWTSIDTTDNQFQIGTFSHFFNRGFSDYEALPDWADEQELPDSTVRENHTDQPALGEDIADIEDFFDGGGSESGGEEESYYSYSGSYSGYSSEDEEQPKNDAEPDISTFFDD